MYMQAIVTRDWKKVGRRSRVGEVDHSSACKLLREAREIPRSSDPIRTEHIQNSRNRDIELQQMHLLLSSSGNLLQKIRAILRCLGALQEINAGNSGPERATQPLGKFNAGSS
jgi:hypothetical protein